jgi:hypothetical protein
VQNTADDVRRPPGNYNAFWLVERDFDNRTSLITIRRTGACRRSCRKLPAGR